MKIRLSVFCSLLFLFFAQSGAFGFPGINAYLPEFSGFYVYYRDYSFPRASYVGFLQYDEGTYAARYYAPAVAGLPADEVCILFTVDTSKNVTELTGEEFITAIVTDDHIVIVNYLHDLVYEISARRRKMPGWSKQNTKAMSSNEQIFLFGGNVVMRYEYYVPVFNLFSVTKPPSIGSPAGEPLFVLATQGLLQSQDDRSFDDFAGIPPRPAPSAQKGAFSEKARARAFSVGGRVFTLDEQWNQPLEDEAGLWTLGDDAAFFAEVSFVEPPPDGSLDDIPYTALDFYSRDHMMSPQDLYVDCAKTAVEKTGGAVKISVSYTGAAGNEAVQGMNNFYLITQKNDVMVVVSFMIFETSYTANKRYFDTLVNNAFKTLAAP